MIGWWNKKRKQKPGEKTIGVRKRIVDNRVFLLGLDDIYRGKMKTHERGELLAAARRITGELDVPVKDVPIEGYYYEDEQLTEYFKLVRTLQITPVELESKIQSRQSFLRLKEVAESPLFGTPVNGKYLISACEDVLTTALKSASSENLNIEYLTKRAFELSSGSEDFSLVTLAALSKDPLVLAALRETTVLYTAPLIMSAMFPPEYEYVWQVDEEIEKRANEFIRSFNALFNEDIPEADLKNAAVFWDACDKRKRKLKGRCVRIGFDDSANPVRHYHWAIDSGAKDLAVKDFWADKIWTTEMYRKKMGWG